MVERAPPTKQDEQYPLLKADTGGGDGGVQPTPTLVTPSWGVTCAPKQSWLVRWPEYISACWMTLILLGISFLVFYALGMEAYRRQPVLIVKCNSSKPGSDVFFHHIVPRGGFTPFVVYEEYIASMATQYPDLHFHLYFLNDDSLQTTFRGPRHPRFINELIPYSGGIPPFTHPKLRDDIKRKIEDFEKRHQNVNITIMCLSKYMSMTALKYKWRSIPLPYLLFYARVFSVWQSGGVAMDLNTFNNNFNNRQHEDRRIAAILKQHNDGINVEEYKNALNKIDREENEFCTVFYALIHQLLNDTRTSLNNFFAYPPITISEKTVSPNEALIRTNRNKRDVSAADSLDKNNKSEGVSNVFVEVMNPKNNTELKKSEYKTLTNPELETLKLNESIKALHVNDTIKINVTMNITDGLNKSEIQPDMLNKSDTAQVVLFYDFSVISDIGPSFIIPDMSLPDSRHTKNVKTGNNGAQLLTIDADGKFVAASSRLHRFLGHLIAAGCQRMPPKFAIQNTLFTQCSEMYKEDNYCDNIYIL
ncbi:uncharacterized protein LOC118264188 [Spodoptera frugiperda]|uniref:Uncharacterized protein LOC118264188 n=1 Tax=Spodoptera frugiperda TaxID=7108 RepID=A0A9R0CXG1_SPOFR|nr:uncharacterized protein LOC118264188 [Spodoptera frugiperda]